MRLLKILAFSFMFLSVSLANAEEKKNSLHPTFILLDKDSIPVIHSENPMSIEQTCAACHDNNFIKTHNTHNKPENNTSCLTCHSSLSNDQIIEQEADESGFLPQSAIDIREPNNENCATCHGLVHQNNGPVSYPEDFSGSINGRDYDRTWETGEIISEKLISESYLNLKDKNEKTFPFDIHAARMLQCVDCHHSDNNPSGVKNIKGSLHHLKMDPRGLPVNEYLTRPSHKMVEPDCMVCHDPLEVHEFLPYKERHFKMMKCQTCHVPEMFGMAQMVNDETVSTDKGTPRIEYRGAEETPQPMAFSAAFTDGFEPFIFPKKSSSGKVQLSPFNLVTHIYWASNGKPVDFAKVHNVFSDGQNYRPEALSIFDSNKDGKLSEQEMRLDNETKISFVKAGLSKQGITNPEIKSTIVPHAVRHGVVTGQWVTKTCTTCHGSDSILGQEIELAGFVPSGVKPEFDQNTSAIIKGQVNPSDKGFSFSVDTESEHNYVFGYGKQNKIDLLGFLIFALTVLGLLGHALLRIVTSKKRVTHQVSFKKTYLYSWYERIWHWLMALSIILLLITGFSIHFASESDFIPFKTAVDLHNIIAIILILNASFALLYHLASAEIRKFIPPKDNLIGDIIEHAKFYLNGIFMGSPHPMIKSKDRKFNPLQQLTYLGLLNFLFPLQFITGILIWGVSESPALSDLVGGLNYIGPLHMLGSWLFLTFLVMHVYLTTTGHTPFAYIKAMVTGYEEIELPHDSAPQKGENHD